jgi:hypothetical protein
LHDDWFVLANMKKDQETLLLFASPDAVWPDMLTLTGDVKKRFE